MRLQANCTWGREFEEDRREPRSRTEAKELDPGDLQTSADAFSKWAEAVERAEGLKGADLANPTRETLKKL